jgi:dipeptidyl aminopeptidase/acylaminoacyl peptidase
MRRFEVKTTNRIMKALTGIVLIVIPLAAEQPQLSREDYARAEQYLIGNIGKLAFKIQVVPRFIGKSDRFWYKLATRDGKEFVLIDPALNTRQPAFDQARLAASLSAASGKAYEANNLPFDGIEFVKDGRAIQFDIEKDRWTADLSTYACTKEETSKEKPEGESLSPDGKWAAFVKDYNLFIRPTAGGTDIQLTTDGEALYDYGSEADQSTVAVTQRLSGKKQPPVLLWSPDSRKILTHKLDQRKVESLHLLQSVPPQGFRPLLHSYRYALVGDPNLPLAELAVLDVEKKTKTAFKTDPYLVLYMSPITTKRAWWSEDSRTVYFVEESRSNKAARLKAADAVTGETRTLIEEKGATYVELNTYLGNAPNVRILGDGAEFIWFSERDGWAHLYLYDGKTGILKNQITKGPWVVGDILRVDEKNRWVYFTAGGREKGRDPYYRHLYREKLDGSGLELLTPEDADHTVTDMLSGSNAFGFLSRFSPSGSYFVDTYSRMDTAPVTVLRDVSGRLVRELEKADLEPLLAAGWKWPERVTVKARDGTTDLYGLLYKPSNFDPAKKYPVIDGIYPGPQITRTPKSFGGNAYFLYEICEDSALAELGFIVVNIDGLGTPFRSKAFHDWSYGKMEEAGGLEDHITGIRQLASVRPYMDISRVGIYGHSGGGFASTHAILAYPDFYKVAVSSAGNHDQRSYLACWGEQYQGLLQGDNYKAQSNAGLAANLKGKLLLVHGDMDDNVHPAMTIQMVDALVKANKDFDLLILPNRNHSFGLDPYFTRRKWDYFVRHLAGAEPPHDYEIKPGKMPS